MEQVPGVVIEPGDDLHALGERLGVGERVVGEVGLPRLVGLLGLEADVGGAWSLRRIRRHRAVADQDAVDRGARDGDLVSVAQVPVDGLRAGIQTGIGQLFAEPHDQLDRRLRCRGGTGLRSSGTRFEDGIALGSVTGHELADPALTHPVGAGDFGLGLAGQDRGDDHPTLRHGRPWPATAIPMT